MTGHRVTTETRTWGNVPPYSPKTLYRAKCSCGWLGEWFAYQENVPTACPHSAVKP